jgi:hypothetical protein
MNGRIAILATPRHIRDRAWQSPTEAVAQVKVRSSVGLDRFVSDHL